MHKYDNVDDLLSNYPEYEMAVKAREERMGKLDDHVWYVDFGYLMVQFIGSQFLWEDGSWNKLTDMDRWDTND